VRQGDGIRKLFHTVEGFDVPVRGGLLTHPADRARVGLPGADVNARMAAATERPVAPALYDGPAPCHEVVIKAPDLTRWPIPTHSPLDAGPFITAGVVIAHDPGDGRHNLSYNRMQIYGPDRAGVSMKIGRDIKTFFDKIERQGVNLPFCVAIGPDPVVIMAAAFRSDGDEDEIAGPFAGRRSPSSPR
jgi:2,5-furandicarboxylate decarboxylase 1